MNFLWQVLALAFLLAWAVVRKYRTRVRYPSTIPVVKTPKDLNYKAVVDAQYTEGRTHTTVTYAKGFLTKNINRTIDSVYQEIDLALDRAVGQGPEPRSINVNDLVLGVFLRVYHRIYLGVDAARNEEWLGLCVEFPKVAVFAALAIAKWPGPLQPLANLILPETRRFRQFCNRVYAFLRSMHQDRLRAVKNPDFKPPADYIQSFIENAAGERANTDLLVEGMGMANLAGVQSTGRVLLQALLDIAAHPQYVEPLRQEVAGLMQESNGDANLTPLQLSRLDLMDSFFKESQKFHHANCLSVYRKIVQPMTLSNGVFLPANSYVALPGTAYSVIEEGGKKRAFDPFQWAEKKRASDGSNRFTYVFSGPDSLEFGAGTHACPGRFLAVNVLKATLSRILMRYDFQLPDGTSRPDDQYNHLLDVRQNTKSVLEFRPRRPAATATALR
ncbi:putative cytochrome P450 oxidoreductase [Aspergillus steynii IBT 23096]|uniref:Putative cytochrome P450 oxidoreductase n=1 Tax=Aspergillus steynii IBT 23096 TaxID=1392250 RepID=A0A2I2FWM4_9EURO|nr:putative cytochrome P450 oxidoreductase [Aspergillus steynii IBT 23096]PLB45028.1 putative cytochrome P450 oxidoreductase [Aspergillus steynii IBT 23096]